MPPINVHSTATNCALVQAELERQEELQAPEGVDIETVQRRKGQLQKLEAGEGLTKLEKISLAEAALEDGVDVYLRRVQERCVYCVEAVAVLG